MRIIRNRCKYCRLQNVLSVGMSHEGMIVVEAIDSINFVKNILQVYTKLQVQVLQTTELFVIGMSHEGMCMWCIIEFEAIGIINFVTCENPSGCLIMRISGNQFQYCRLQKCLSTPRTRVCAIYRTPLGCYENLIRSDLFIYPSRRSVSVGMSHEGIWCIM